MAIAVAECCISGDKMIGAKIELEEDIRADALLFGESQSRIVISCSREKIPGVEVIAKKNNVPFSVIGNTGGGSLTVDMHGKEVFSVTLAKLKDVWQNALRCGLEQE